MLGKGLFLLVMVTVVVQHSQGSMLDKLVDKIVGPDIPKNVNSTTTEESGEATDPQESDSQKKEEAETKEENDVKDTDKKDTDKKEPDEKKDQGDADADDEKVKAKRLLSDAIKRYENLEEDTDDDLEKLLEMVYENEVK